MTVHELIEALFAAGDWGRTDRIAPLEMKIREAAIEEASVGEVEVKIYESEDELTAPVGSPERIVTCNERFIAQAWIPEGKYRLVKKENP